MQSHCDDQCMNASRDTDGGNLQNGATDSREDKIHIREE